MNTAAQNRSRHIGKNDTRSSTEIKSADALPLIANNCVAHITITPPVGGQLSTKCKTIGFHSERLLLVEIPDLVKRNTLSLVQEGFWVRLKVFTERGNGVVLNFRSQIAHVITQPLPMLVLSLPTSMQQQRIRRSPRFKVDLSTALSVADRTCEARLLDISKHGGLLETSLLSKMLPINQSLSFDFSRLGTHFLAIGQLKCRVRNAHRAYSGLRYGVEFDEQSLENAKLLLSQLTFDGDMLVPSS